MCVAVLALGIGANAAIFSVLNGVILQALPYPDPARLVFVWQRFPAMPEPLGSRMRVSRKTFVEWQRQNTAFSQMAAFEAQTLNETGSEHPRALSVAFVSADLLPMLGVKPRTGRLFTRDEERPGNDRVILLSDAYFERRFAHSPSAIGRTVAIAGTAYTVIGVLPPKFHLPATSQGQDQVKADVWAPLSRIWITPADDKSLRLQVAARLKPGVTVVRARADMETIAQRLAQSDEELTGWTATVFNFQTEDTGPELHRAIYVLMGAVGFLLLIACANLANLTLARATLRSREIAIRLALGASRGRIVSQLVAESFLVSLAGAGLGLLLATWCIQLALALKPEDIQRPEAIGIDLWVFAFSAIAAIATTVLFGLAPALAVSRPDLNHALKTGGAAGSTAVRSRSRQFLIAVEVALALVLLVGAGLMIRSFQRLLAVGIGFQTERLTAMDVELPAVRYRDPSARSRFFRRLVEQAGAAPGIASAAVVDTLPLHQVTMSNFYIAGRPDPPVNQLPICDKTHVSPAYFSTLGLRLEAGRWFTDADLAFTEKDGNAVAIVNQAFVRQFFPHENPIGGRLLDSDRKHTSEIVGIVSDYRPMGVEAGPRSIIFWPDLRLPSATLVVRSSATPQSLAKLLRETIWALDKQLPAAQVFPMQHWVDEWLSQRKFNTLLLGIFAGLALVLGMLGIYGVLAHLVTARTREIGIRMAIGASPGAIARLVLKQSMAPVMVGLAAGLAGSLALGGFIETLLFAVQPRDPLTLALASLAILAISPVAIWMPLRRATQVDCTVTLREE